MLGLMQDHPLTTPMILEYAEKAHGSQRLISRLVEGSTVISNYSEFAHRVRKLAGGLIELGVRPGERVASLAWNTHRHMELFYPVTGIGAVLHTVNPRLHDKQIEYVFAHGGARILFTM